MKNRELVNLLNRTAAALENPRDLTLNEQDCLIEDLLAAAKEMNSDFDQQFSNHVQFPYFKQANEFTIRRSSGSVESRKGVKPKYPFKLMEPGDFFDVPADHESAQRIRKGFNSRVQSAAHCYGHRYNMRFVTFTLENKSIRVCRVS